MVPIDVNFDFVGLEIVQQPSAISSRLSSHVSSSYELNSVHRNVKFSTSWHNSLLDVEIAAVELSHHVINSHSNCVIYFIDSNVDLISRDSWQRPNVVINVALVKRNVWYYNCLEHFEDELC